MGLKRGCQREGGIAKRNLSQELLFWLVAVGLWLRLSWGPNVKAFLHGQHYSGSKAVMPVKIFFSSHFVEGAGSLPWPGGSATKPGKPKGKKKISSVRQKFDVSVRAQMASAV